MNRRKALAITASVVGTTIIGAEVFLTGCNPDTKIKPSNTISEEDIIILDEIGETIIPETNDSPGAKAASIGKFMRTMVNDCYDSEEADIFRAGISDINNKAITNYSKAFFELSKNQKLELLNGIDQTARSGSEEESIHYFSMIKQLTIWGYFTSEPGATKALRYNPIPGRYNGCIEYKNGDKAWA